MKWLNNNKNLLIIGLVIAAVLTAAYFIGDSSSNNSSEIHVKTEDSVSLLSSTEHSENKQSSDAQSSKEVALPKKRTESIPDVNESSAIIESAIDENEKSIAVSSKEPVSSEKPVEKREITVITQTSETISYAEQQENSSYSDESFINENSEISENELVSNTIETSEQEQESSNPEIIAEISDKTEYTESCTLFISCNTALNNERLSRSKRAVLPENGIVYPETVIGFNDGESVFDVLKRVCTENKIHLDFSSIPVTGGAYIKGINNLYEFDCGPVSGWMYRVNGEYPNVGCSDYKLSSKDEVAFLYSCDLGADIGNIYKGE